MIIIDEFSINNYCDLKNCMKSLKEIVLKNILTQVCVYYLAIIDVLCIVQNILLHKCIEK